MESKWNRKQETASTLRTSLMEDTPLVILGFLSIAHILGAVLLGSAIRGFWKAIQGQEEPIFGHLFFLFFGGLFGCFPLAFGLQANIPLWVLGGQLSILSITFIVTVLFGQAVLRWTRSLLNINTGLLILGGIFIIAGLFGSYVMFDAGEGFPLSLIFGGVFILIGFGICLLGLINLFRNFSS